MRFNPKDTVTLGANETVRVAITWNSQFLGTYVFHCHNISHEDHMMMTQFEVMP